MTIVSETLQFILSQATREDITRIGEAIKMRHKLLGQINASSIRVGQKVKIVNISPKYLGNRTGLVKCLDGKYGTVILDTPVYHQGQHWGRTEVTGVPLSSLEVQ